MNANNLKSKLNLRYTPVAFTNITSANSFVNHSEKMQLIVLGECGTFYVCCPTDAAKMVKSGYEYCN